MKISLNLLWLFLARAGAHTVTPVEKVITLLENLKEQCSEAAAEDAKTYDMFACFAKNQADNKLAAITKSKEKIASHKAQIEMLDGEITELNSEIPKLKEKVKKLTKKQEEADKKRKEEFEKYTEKEQDLASAIDAIKRAIEALEESKKKMKGAKLGYTLAQLHPDLKKVADAAQNGQYEVSAKQLSAILALLDVARPAPDTAHASEYKSNDIINTLQDLLKKFKVDKNDLDTTEAETRNEYEMTKQSRENTIKFAKEDIDAKEKLVAEKEEEKEKLEKEKEEETADKEADQGFLKDLKKTAEQKAKDFDQRSGARAAELSALAEAIEILKGGVQANYGANKKLTGFLASVQDHKASQKSPVAFFQVQQETLAPTKVLAFLTQQAAKLQSPILSTLALKLKVGVGKDHFVKIRGLIKDLVSKLEADAEAEETQKTFCDEKMKDAITNRDEANGAIEGKTADIDAATSKVAELTAEIKQLQVEIADLQKGLFEAKELRAKEEAANEKTIADSEAGLKAVKDAIEVLKGFYEFIQTGHKQPKDRDGNTVGDLAPKTEEGEYEGNKDAAKGILGLLDVIVSDFERTIEKTKKEEEDAKKEFEEYEKDTKADIKDKADSKKSKTEDKESTEADITDFKQDLKDEQDNLKDAKAELAKLKPMCVDSPEDWATRRRKMKQEVEALKEALTILEDWKQ